MSIAVTFHLAIFFHRLNEHNSNLSKPDCRALGGRRFAKLLRIQSNAGVTTKLGAGEALLASDLGDPTGTVNVHRHGKIMRRVYNGCLSIVVARILRHQFLWNFETFLTR